jgi:GNAT superfamily N-acetyltransferase
VADLIVEPLPHGLLSPDDVDGLRRLFDAEYLAEHGEWDPEQPYGYAPHDVHVIARAAGDVVGHVGWARRLVAVGDWEVQVAGVGGVLTAPAWRGQGLGGRLLDAARRSMIAAGGLRFGYLGCREEVVPFYRANGWLRVVAPETSISRRGVVVEEPAGQPLLVLPLGSPPDSWPDGPVDLRGRAW